MVKSAAYQGSLAAMNWYKEQEAENSSLEKK